MTKLSILSLAVLGIFCINSYANTTTSLTTATQVTKPKVSYTPGNQFSIRPTITEGILTPVGQKLAKQQILTRNLYDNPVTLDPDKMSDSSSIHLARTMYDTLVRQLPNGKYVGAAAQSYSVSSDGKTWTFKLRPNATWSDGTPVTAQDFVYAWQRLVRPSTGSAYADYLVNANVVNAKQIVIGDLPSTDLGVSAVDDHTFVINLTQPTPWLPELVAFVVLAPVPKHLVEKYGEDQWANIKNIATNGPYKLTEYVVNGHITLEKRNDYWDAKHVHITKSNYVFLTNINTVYNKYLANELMTADIPPNLWEKVLNERPQELKEYFDPVVYFVDFNLQKVPNLEVRRALRLLIDNRFLTNKILKAGQPTSIYVPQFMQDAQLSTEAPYFNQPYQQNVDQAIKLLGIAGYSKDHPLEITLTAMRDQLMDQTLIAFMGWFQQNSKGLVHLKTQILDNNNYQSTIQNRNFELRLGFRKADYDQASSFYNLLLCHNTQNYTGWCNDKYDQYVTDANKESNNQIRAELYAKASDVIQQDVPVIPLFVKSAYLLQSPALGGLSLKVKRRYLRDYFIIADKKVAKSK